MKNYPTGHDVWHWPEFLAFARRLGIDTDELPTTDVVIRLPIRGCVEVQQTYLGRNLNDTADTTTMDNDVFETRRPVEPRFSDEGIPE